MNKTQKDAVISRTLGQSVLGVVHDAEESFLKLDPSFTLPIPTLAEKLGASKVDIVGSVSAAEASIGLRIYW